MDRFVIILCLLVLVAFCVLSFGAWIVAWGWLPFAVAFVLMALAVLTLRYLVD
jgi:hypothetical protein